MFCLLYMDICPQVPRDYFTIRIPFGVNLESITQRSLCPPVRACYIIKIIKMREINNAFDLSGIKKNISLTMLYFLQWLENLLSETGRTLFLLLCFNGKTKLYLVFTFHREKDPGFSWPESCIVWGPSLRIENDKYNMSFQCHPVERKMRWRNGKNSSLNGLQWEYLTYANFTGMYDPLLEL